MHAISIALQQLPRILKEIHPAAMDLTLQIVVPLSQ